MIDLAGATDACVEPLPAPVVPLQGVRIKYVAPLFGEGQAAFVAAKVDSGDKALVAEMTKRILVGVEVLYWHHSERPDNGQRATVLPI